MKGKLIILTFRVLVIINFYITSSFASTCVPVSVLIEYHVHSGALHSASIAKRHSISTTLPAHSIAVTKNAGLDNFVKYHVTSEDNNKLLLLLFNGWKMPININKCVFMNKETIFTCRGTMLLGISILFIAFYDALNISEECWRIDAKQCTGKTDMK